MNVEQTVEQFTRMATRKFVDVCITLKLLPDGRECDDLGLRFRFTIFRLPMSSDYTVGCEQV